jgi:hypothetical protein
VKAAVALFAILDVPRSEFVKGPIERETVKGHGGEVDGELLMCQCWNSVMAGSICLFDEISRKEVLYRLIVPANV